MQSVVSLERPQEYLEAIEEIKNSFAKSVELVHRLKELGEKFGLTNEQIRHDIEQALANVVKPRQLRSLLPLELKRNYKPRPSNKLAKTAKLPEPKALKSTKEFVFIGHLSKTSKNRLAVAFPATETKTLQRFIGKKIKVILTECD